MIMCGSAILEHFEIWSTFSSERKQLFKQYFMVILVLVNSVFTILYKLVCLKFKVSMLVKKEGIKVQLIYIGVASYLHSYWY